MSPPGTRWLYSDYLPTLLALALQAATGRTIADMLAADLWPALGAEAELWVSIDDATPPLTRTPAGLSMCARDLLRFGVAVLNGAGLSPLASSAWFAVSTRNEPHDPAWLQDLGPTRFGLPHVGYKYFWWTRTPERSTDFAAVGNFGQYLYISPAYQSVVVRLGSGWGQFGNPNWFDLVALLARL